MPRRVIKKLPTIGRASRLEAFDPDAIDGDNDGIVQELTRFERPATARTISGAMSKPFDINQPVPEIIDALIKDPSLYDLAPEKIPSVIFEMAGGDRELFERSRIRNVTPKGQWSEKRIMDLVNGIKIEPSPDGIFTIVAPPIPEIRELIGFDGDFSNVRIPSSEARIRMYKAILENLKENKNEKRAYAETISEKLYKKADNGLFLPRSEYSDMRESLGEQYMPGTPFHPFDAIYERFLRLSNDMMFGTEMYQMEYVQVMHDFYGHLGTGRGFDRHGEWANYLAMVHAAETVSEGDDEIIDQVAWGFFDRIMTSQLAAWEEVDEKRGIKTAQEAKRLIWEIIQEKRDAWIDRDTMRQIIGIDDPITYSRPKTKSLSEEPKTIRKRAVAYLHSMVDNNIVETGQMHSSFVKKRANVPVDEKSLRKLNNPDRFDPNAIDADGDGKVQDATRFERPGAPRVPKPSRVTGAMARTAQMTERDKRIVQRYKAGESRKNIAEAEGTTVQGVGWALNQARKRGEITEEPRWKPNPERAKRILDAHNAGKTTREIAEIEGMTINRVSNIVSAQKGRKRTTATRDSSIEIPKDDQELLDMYDAGKTVVELAKERNSKPGEVLKTLVKYRLPDEDGRMTIPRSSTGLKGSIGTTPKPTKSILDYIDDPKLDLDAEAVGKSIGFWGGWPVVDDPELGEGHAEPSVNYKNHPVYSYDLETGKPVKILGLHSTSEADIESIIKSKKYEIRGSGNFGRGGNFSFDGDPYMAEAYGEDLHRNSTEELKKIRRLVARLELENPIVVNVGVLEPDENTTHEWYPDDSKERKNRAATLEERQEEYIKQLGGTEKVRGLYKLLLDVAKGGDDSPAGVKITFKYEPSPEQIKYYEEIVNGGKINMHSDAGGLATQELNLLARAAGHDGIVWINTPGDGAESSHVIVFDEDKIKVLGARPAYSEESIAYHGGMYDRGRDWTKYHEAMARRESAQQKLSGSIGKPKPKTNKTTARRETRKISGAVSSDWWAAKEKLERDVVRDFLSTQFTQKEIAARNKISVSTVNRILSTTGANEYVLARTRPGGRNEGGFAFQDEYPVDPTEIVTPPRRGKNFTRAELRRRATSSSVLPTEPSSLRANRRSKLPKTDADTPPARGETIKTPGVITGAMANENPTKGKKITTSIDVVKKDNKNSTVTVKYGDLDFTFDVNPNEYTEWVDAYDEWVGWRGNYGMRLASAALMGEPLPSSAGYMGDDEGTHVHDLLGNGTTPNISRSEMNDARRAIRDAFIGLNYINSGKEVNMRPIYRGLSNVTPGDQVMNLSAGEIITLPLSAFTSDLQTAKMYAIGVDGDTTPGVILEIVPGARTGDAAGEEYMHQFNIGGEWVTDVTEQVTQGRFKYVRTSTDYIERNGQRTKVKKITLEQVETFNPITGTFEKNLGRSSKITGSMGTKVQEKYLGRLGDIREITKGLIAQDMQSLRERAMQNYVQRNPVFIKRLADINQSNKWKADPAAINPDGSPMTKAQYIAMVNAEQRISAETYLSKRLNNYAPDFNPWHLQQLQYNIEMMYMASPEMYLLANTYGFPQFAIFSAQEITGADGKPKFFPNSEVRAQNMPGAGNGVTLMNSSISAILPVGSSSFIPKGAQVNDALQDPELLLRGHWGISPEFFIDRFPDDPLSMITRYTEVLATQRMSKFSRPAVIDEGSPVTVLRHEASHSIHNNALAKAKLDIEADPKNQDAQDAHVILSLLNKPSWQSAAGIDLSFVNMMLKDSVSDYAASSPPEWLSETLTAALSPSRVTRNLLSFNQRAILARAFPELSNYLTGSTWP